jgi:hypothetical protein
MFVGGLVGLWQGIGIGSFWGVFGFLMGVLLFIANSTTILLKPFLPD